MYDQYKLLPKGGQKKTSTSSVVEMELVNTKENADTLKKKFVDGRTKPKEKFLKKVENREKSQKFNQSWKVGLF